jgi:purine-cytosine permease-like protein
LPKARLGKFAVELPRNRALRITLGVALVIGGGVFGFLPVLGHWMVPLGLVVLASDNAAIRRFNRRTGLAIVSWWKGRKPRPRNGAA